MEFEDIV